MKPGYLALVLHAHLPFVREIEDDDSLQQHWLFEAITDCSSRVISSGSNA